MTTEYSTPTENVKQP